MWHSVKEKLPEINEEVLVCRETSVNRYHETMCFRQWGTDSTCFSGQYHNYPAPDRFILKNGTDKITHWMPLPKLPDTFESILAEIKFGNFKNFQQ